MKKLIILFALTVVFSMSVFSAENDKKTKDGYEHTEGKWSDLSYVNVPILKVLEGKDGYVVIYQKNRVGTGSIVIPKKWGKGDNDNPRKLKLRSVKQSNAAYMTILKKNGEFQRVILNMPLNKANPIWGITNSRKNLDGADKDTLEELDL